MFTRFIILTRLFSFNIVLDESKNFLVVIIVVVVIVVDGIDVAVVVFIATARIRTKM